jgi:adenine-specific DNA-methyltransferase
MNKPVIQPLESAHTQSANLLEGNLAQLKALFPEAFKEGGIDFEVLKQLLGGQIDEREEKYGLNWHGKRRARQIALTPSAGTLRPCPEDSVDWDTTQNLMIEGDNLEVLKLLQKSYAGKVKMIYIDPPYNTGKDFVYPDNFTDNIKNYLELTGQTDGQGRKLSSNTESSGRFHTDWLNMMYPRLKLARNLLEKDGVVLISIDDSEVTNLRRLCDEIFGEECWVATVAWQNSSRQSDLVAIEHEYVVIYGKNPSVNGVKWNKSRDISDELQALVDTLRSQGKPQSVVQEALAFEINSRLAEDEHRGTKENAWLSNYKNIDEKWNIYYAVDLTGEGAGPPRIFNGKSVPAPTGRHWMGQDYIDQLALEDRIVWRADRAYRKLYIQESLDNLKSVIRMPTRNGSELLKQLLGKDVFDKPKPVNFLRHFFHYALDDKDIVLDFFAGSGTTGHALFEQNSRHDKNQRFILVQLPEQLNPENSDQKIAAEFCDSIGKPRNIAELTKERLRRAAIKIRASRADSITATGQLSLENEPEKAQKPPDLGFKVFKLDTSNIRAWNPNPDELEGTLMAQTEHLASGRSEGDVLYEILLKQGLDLALPLQKKLIAGHAVHSVGAGALLVCLAKDGEDKNAMAEASVTPANAEALALGMADWHAELAADLGQMPAELATRVVLRDSLFDGDVAKTNLTAILRQRGLEDVRSL